MNTPDFVTIERAARKLHDAEVRRIFGQIGQALAHAGRHLLHGLHVAHLPAKPKHFA